MSTVDRVGYTGDAGQVFKKLKFKNFKVANCPVIGAGQISFGSLRPQVGESIGSPGLPTPQNPKRLLFFSSPSLAPSAGESIGGVIVHVCVRFISSIDTMNRRSPPRCSSASRATVNEYEPPTAPRTQNRLFRDSDALRMQSDD